MFKSFQAVLETRLRYKAIINKDNTPDLNLPQSFNTTIVMILLVPCILQNRRFPNNFHMIKL